jgi:uncharacterized protein YbjT (DUF2867 family)
MANHLATVFGGSGFIGRHLVQRLVARGWRVRVAVRDPEAAKFLEPYGDVGQVVPVYADLTKEFTVQAAADGASLVVNAVGILFERGKSTFQAIHADGAGRVAAAARTAGAEALVHISALGADGQSPSAYARSKAAGEAAVRAAFPAAAIIRPSVVFGPEDDFFNRFARLTNYTPALPVFVGDGFRLGGAGPGESRWFGSGGLKTQPVYAGDVADAILAAAAADRAGQIFSLGGPRVYSLLQIYQMVLTHTKRRRWLVPLPMSVARLQAAFLQFLPNPPLTPDQVKLMMVDNVVPPGSPGLAELGISATAAEMIVPTYLSRFQAPVTTPNPG